MKRMLLIVGLVLAGGTAHAAGQTYTGNFEGGRGVLVLNGSKASLTLNAANCIGQIQGAPFVRHGDDIEVTQAADGSGGACHVRLTLRVNRVIKSQEDSNCMAWHGASCSFNG